jgi:hypothetical protein
MLPLLISYRSYIESSHSYRLCALSTRGPKLFKQTGVRCPNEHHHLPVHGVDRNGLFYGLSREERVHIDCVEYQALRLLSYIIPAYVIVWQALGCLALGAYISLNRNSAALANDLNSWYVFLLTIQGGANEPFLGGSGRFSVLQHLTILECRCWISAL